jgi:hypothetical protein
MAIVGVWDGKCTHSFKTLVILSAGGSKVGKCIYPSLSLAADGSCGVAVVYQLRGTSAPQAVANKEGTLGRSLHYTAENAHPNINPHIKYHPRQ